MHRNAALIEVNNESLRHAVENWERTEEGALVPLQYHALADAVIAHIVDEGGPVADMRVIVAVRIRSILRPLPDFKARTSGASAHEVHSPRRHAGALLPFTDCMMHEDMSQILCSPTGQ